MRQISLNGADVNLPENWSEIDRSKLSEILKYVFVLPESGSTYHNILRIVLGYNQKQWGKIMSRLFGKKSKNENKDTSAQVLAELLRTLSWMWEGDLAIKPFESFEVDGQPWLLYTEGFTTMSFGELSDAYIHAQAFIKQLVEGEDRLNLLVATLCRPRRTGNYTGDTDWNGDDRQQYNEHIAQRHAKILEEKYFEQKVLVLVYFLGSVKNFFSYFDLFGDGDKPPVSEEFPGQSLIKNQHLLAEKSIFGNMSQTKKANVHEVFQFLEEHNKDVKAEIERNKKES